MQEMEEILDRDELEEFRIEDLQRANAEAYAMARWDCDGKEPSKTKLDEWFSYYFYGEVDPDETVQPEDVLIEDDILPDFVLEVLAQEPEVRSTFPWEDEYEREKRIAQRLEEEAAWQYLRDSYEPRLPGMRVMTVETKRGKGVYEYVSVRTGGRIPTKNGSWYYKEKRYPIKDGELRPRRRGGLPPDSMADEALRPLGYELEDRTTETLVNICREQTTSRRNLR